MSIESFDSIFKTLIYGLLRYRLLIISISNIVYSDKTDWAILS
jgi:hypothetical protein